MIFFKCIYRYDLKLYINIGDDISKKEISSAKEWV